MAISRKKFREAAFQALYSNDVGEGEISRLLKEKGKLPSSAVREVEAFAAKVKKVQKQLDDHLNAVPGYEKVGPIERNILRLALYELTFERECPGEVVIAEAVRICQKFGTQKSSKYVNAILDTIFKEASS